MTKKNLFVLSAVLVSSCVAVICGQFFGQTSSAEINNDRSSSILRADGDPMPPFPKPPAHNSTIA